jgi:hypothetical protein
MSLADDPGVPTGTALALLFAAPLAAHSRRRAPFVPAPAPGVVLLSL